MAERLAAKDEEMNRILEENKEQIRASLTMQLQAAFDVEKKRLEDEFEQEKARLRQELAQATQQPHSARPDGDTQEGRDPNKKLEEKEQKHKTEKERLDANFFEFEQKL
jgi:hypothetical protein